MDNIKQYEKTMSDISYVGNLQERIIKLISRHLKQDRKSRILEIGCGTGTFMAKLANAYPNTEIIGLEPYTKFATVARSKLSKYPNCNIICQKLAKYNPNQKFNFIVTSFVYHHIPDDQKTLFLLQVKELLNKGGLILLGDEFIAGYDSLKSKQKSINLFYNELDEELIRNHASETTLGLTAMAREQSLNNKLEHKISVQEFYRRLTAIGAKIIEDFHLWPKNKQFGCKLYVICKEEKCR